MISRQLLPQDITPLMQSCTKYSLSQHRLLKRHHFIFHLIRSRLETFFIIHSISTISLLLPQRYSMWELFKGCMQVMGLSPHHPFHHGWLLILPITLSMVAQHLPLIHLQLLFHSPSTFSLQWLTKQTLSGRLSPQWALSKSQIQTLNSSQSTSLTQKVVSFKAWTIPWPSSQKRV